MPFAHQTTTASITSLGWANVVVPIPRLFPAWFYQMAVYLTTPAVWNTCQNLFQLTSKFRCLTNTVSPQLPVFQPGFLLDQTPAPSLMTTTGDTTIVVTGSRLLEGLPSAFPDASSCSATHRPSSSPLAFPVSETLLFFLMSSLHNSLPATARILGSDSSLDFLSQGSFLDHGPLPILPVSASAPEGPHTG